VYVAPVALNLGPGEEILFEGHPCWRAILSFYVKGILIVAVIAAIAILLDASTALVLLIVIGGAALVVLVGLIRRISTRYTITTRRLNIKHGIISRDVQETKIERVQDVNYRQTFLQRILQIGDVDFDTAAENSSSDFVFAGVANPEEVVDHVHHATEPAASPPRSQAEAERRYDSGL
jgi:uncharacterized membrane protein YdbT with pleckstrin-like domain